MLDIMIIMNNYFHDVATAVLISAAAIMWALSRRARGGDVEEAVVLARFYPLLTRFAIIALAWVIVGGIPRAIFFESHDLGAVRDDLVPAIAVKHIVEVAAVLGGVLMWRRVRHQIETAARIAR